MLLGRILRIGSRKGLPRSSESTTPLCALLGGLIEERKWGCERTDVSQRVEGQVLKRHSPERTLLLWICCSEMKVWGELSRGGTHSLWDVSMDVSISSLSFQYFFCSGVGEGSFKAFQTCWDPEGAETLRFQTVAILIP